ncbi:MAG: Uma2 family endonuclease [Acidimicrobiales bacterium]
MSTAARPAVPFTVSDVWEMPDDGYRHELIDGVLIVTPSPSLIHQRASGRLLIELSRASSPEFEVIGAPFDWKLGSHSVFQPDLLVARTADLGPLRLERTPLLVVEIQSPSTRRVDFLLKRSAFESAGVADYWLVDPDQPGITHLALIEGVYAEVARVGGDEIFKANRPFPVSFIPSDLVRAPG